MAIQGSILMCMIIQGVHMYIITIAFTWFLMVSG